MKGKCSLYIREERNKFILENTTPVFQLLFLWEPMLYLSIAMTIQSLFISWRKILMIH